MVQAVKMNASVSVESPEEQSDQLRCMCITARRNICYQNEEFGGHSSVLYDTISSSRGQTDRYSQTSESSLVHGYNYPQLIGNYEYSEIDDCLVESSTGTQLDALDSNGVPSNHYQGLRPETKDYMTLYHTASRKGNRVERNGKEYCIADSRRLDPPNKYTDLTTQN